MCKLPPCLKMITVSLYITLLFLDKTVTLFLLINFINELNKAGVFVATAEPWHAQLQDLGPLWWSAGNGLHLVSYILPLVKCRCPKLKFVAGQCISGQLFVQGLFLKVFWAGKWRLHGMDDAFTLLQKNHTRGQQAMTISAGYQTHVITCSWTEWRSCPRLCEIS